MRRLGIYGLIFSVPFFATNDWVAAGELKAGDSLFCYSGEKVKLDSVFTFRTDTTTAVYNLEASGNHNYYVSASKVLVHNCGGAIRNTIPRTESVLGHIFKNTPGHVNPTTIASKNRYLKIFEHVANNPQNLNMKILDGNAIRNGVQGFSQTFRNGKQVWVHGRNGRIFDAGVNNIPR